MPALSLFAAGLLLAIPPAADSVAAERAKALQTTFIKDPFLATRFSGVVRITQGAHVLFEHAQGQDRAGKPFSADSIFWLASISKTLTAHAMLVLVEQGKVALGDPVGRHIPGWTDTSLRHEGAACTIFDLLAHQCGLGRDMPMPYRAGRLAESPTHRQAFLDATAKAKLAFKPGSNMAYSNWGLSLAGVVVAEVADMPFDAFIHQHALKALNLIATGTNPQRIDAFEERIAPMQTMLGSVPLSAERWLGLDPQSTARSGTSGNAFSTPAELSTWFRAVARGQMLKPALHHEMITPHNSDKDYGLGIVIGTKDEPTMRWHNGALEPQGISTFVGYLPESDLTIVVLLNRTMYLGSATRVAGSLRAVLAGEAYTSPYKGRPIRWLFATLPFILYVALPVGALLYILWLMGRPNTKPLLTATTNLVIWAWTIAFLRSMLTGVDLLWLSASLLLLVFALAKVLPSNPELQWFATAKPLSTVRKWSGHAFNLLAFAALSWFMPSTIPMTLAFIAVAALTIVWLRRSGRLDRTGPQAEDPQIGV